eukprot:4563613-Ditylum_brightwellii.AAC.1
MSIANAERGGGSMRRNRLQARGAAQKVSSARKRLMPRCLVTEAGLVMVLPKSRSLEELDRSRCFSALIARCTWFLFYHRSDDTSQSSSMGNVVNIFRNFHDNIPSRFRALYSTGEKQIPYTCDAYLVTQIWALIMLQAPQSDMK